MIRGFIVLAISCSLAAGATWSDVNIVFEGDSLTARNGSNVDGTPNVATKISTRQSGATVSNVATSGHRTDQIEATGASQVDALLSATKLNVLVCLMGANDFDQDVTAAAAYQNFQDFWNARVAAGWDACIAFTMSDANLVGVANFENDFNTSIRNGYAAMGLRLIDMAVAPAFDDYSDATYYQTDGVHFKDAGIEAFADLVEDEVDEYLVEASTVYIRDGGTGNGTSWSDALDDLPATLFRGNVYYVADGSYAAYIFDDAARGTETITIKKATASDHGTETGWLSSYGDGQAIFNSKLQFRTSYWEFNGATRDESNWFDGTAYGFKVAHASQDQQITVSRDGTADSNITIKYTWLEALDTALPGTTIRRYGFDMDRESGTGTSTGIVLHRNLWTDGNVPLFFRNTDGPIVEYCAFYNNQSNGANHGETMSAYYSCHRVIFRWNQVDTVRGTACIAFTTTLLASPSDGFEIYGNLIWNLYVGDGVFGFNRASDSIHINTKIYNNTIVDRLDLPGNGNSGTAIRDGSNNEIKNNLWFNTQTGFGHIDGTISHNAYSWTRTETSVQTGLASSIFLDYSGDDFRLASATDAGTTLGAPYNQDMFGNTRGADGTWDRGAFEFDSGGGETAAVITGGVTILGAILQ